MLDLNALNALAALASADATRTVKAEERKRALTVRAYNTGNNPNNKSLSVSILVLTLLFANCHKKKTDDAIKVNP